ncbi:MAG: hypothetical protein IH628_15060, partial [Proteobacteria bacterium]|nr:hypothetical protein [Pseudomonadota bacterium]
MKKLCSLVLLILLSQALALSQPTPAISDSTSESTTDTLGAVGFFTGVTLISGLNT